MLVGDGVGVTDLDCRRRCFMLAGGQKSLSRGPISRARRPGEDVAHEPGGGLRIFGDKLAGKTSGRPELAAYLDYLRPSDTLVVPSLSRLSGLLAD